MTAVRVSPGVYKDDKTGKTVKAKTQAEAQKMLSGGSTPTTKPPVTAKPAPTPTQTLATNVAAQPVDTVSGQVAANKIIADQTAADAQRLANAGTQKNPYGNQTISTDANGQIVVDQQLNAAQQKLMEQDTGISQSGRQTAQDLQNKYNFSQGFNPELAARTTTADLGANRQRIEDAVYGKLTKDVATEQAQETEQASQTLRNRGIPLGSPLYDREMKKLTDRYQGVKDSARQQAIAMGGEEYSRDFGINEQTRANQLSEQQGIRNQQIGEVSQFANTGTGLQTPQFQGYQGVNYTAPSATDVYGTVTGAQQNQQQIDIAKRQADAAIAKMNRGAGGGGDGRQRQPQQRQPAAPPNPFNNTTAPGV